MEPHEQARKLADISKLPPLELQEWFAVVTGKSTLHQRPPFAGEIAALMDRARRLGVDLA